MGRPGGQPRAGEAMKELVGRSQELAVLDGALDRAAQGRGGLLLLAGEAGIGKTFLLQVALAGRALRVLAGPSRDLRGPAPYSPVVALLRAHLATVPTALDHVPYRSLLALLLPELGTPTSENGRTPTLLQGALRAALRLVTEGGPTGGPTVLLLEDLHWADYATLDLLPLLPDWLADRPVLILGTYRHEALPRSHPLRRARQELRRTGEVEELSLGALTAAGTAELVAAVVGGPVAADVLNLVYGHSEGVPLYVREYAAALHAGDRLSSGPDGRLTLVPGRSAVLPQTLRDAVLLGLDRLSPEVQLASETAAVLGATFDLEVLADLLPDESVCDTLIECGLLTEDAGKVSFRHGLIRDVVYAGIPWARRRGLHRQVAAALSGAGAPPGVTADHWLAGHEPERARAALLLAAEESCRLHAYRDAAEAAGRALELWPAGKEEARRLEVLAQLGHCALACGLLSEAARAWREAAQAQHEAGNTHGVADARRRLAGTLDLQGLWEQASETRRVAAEAFGRCGADAEAAEERLALGTTLRAVSRNVAALEVLALALLDARRAGRRDLEARILGQYGNALARSGQTGPGLKAGREALSIAIEGAFTGATVEVLHRLADSLEHGGDFLGARAAYADAFELCEETGPAAFACRACVTVPLYQNGAWDRAASECRVVLASPGAPSTPRAVAGAMLGTILAHRGQPARARPFLTEALGVARQAGVAAVKLRALWGLALVEEGLGQPDAATARAQELLAVWEDVEDHYHILSPLRWASSFFAGLGAERDLRRAAEALGRAATLNGGPVALSALAHALGELAWLGGHLDSASEQFRIAVDLLRDSDSPYEECATRLRAGLLLKAQGQVEAAAEHLSTAHRTASTLHAVSLERHSALALVRLGYPVERRGTRAEIDGTGLTRRQNEVLKLVALGRSDKAIARELRLSPRTVEMHVGHILASLDSRSRTEAVSRAADLGLLDWRSGPAPGR
ncbi:ATP-binding protein [Deinococcus altitudinis]|uniref:ATP-binding protein n=1 Tax=Deinococcus altitudinis TaxID=468914 RepID=UPI0038923010